MDFIRVNYDLGGAGPFWRSPSGVHSSGIAKSDYPAADFRDPLSRLRCGRPNLQQWSACSGSAQNGSVGRAKARRTRRSFGIYGGKYGPRISEIGWAVQFARPAAELPISDFMKSGTDGIWTV